MNASTRPSPSPDRLATESPVTPTPRPNGRPTSRSPEVLDLIFTLIREEGFSPSAAAEESGIGRATLSRWRRLDLDLDTRLAYARSQYRRSRLGIIRSATTKDGRPDWRAAAWELERAFPEDYCMNPKRRAAFRALRDAEADEWERTCTEFEEEQARALSGSSPVAPTPSPAAGTSASETPFQLFQNPPSDQPPASAAPGMHTYQKLQNPPPTHPSRRPAASPAGSEKPFQKFQNPARKPNPAPLSSTYQPPQVAAPI